MMRTFFCLIDPIIHRTIDLGEWSSRQGGGGRGRFRSRPLISGHLTRTRIASAPDRAAGSGTTIRAELKLNPTKFVQSQTVHVLPDGTARDWISPICMVENLDRTPLRNETVLTPSANLIVGDRNRFAVSLPDKWLDLTGIYLSEVDRLVADRLRASANAIGGAIGHRPYVCLREIEIYWEFWSENAITQMNEIEPSLMAIGLEARSRAFQHGYSVYRRVHNTRSVEARLSSDTFVKIYAKTTKRIRFEVIVKKGAIKAVNNNRYTFDRLSDLLGIIPRLNEVAALAVNDVLDHLQSQRCRQIRLITPTGFVGEICRHVQEGSVAAQLISLLVINGVIAPMDQDPLQPSVLALVRAGVLERSRPRAREFVVAPEYRYALSALRELEQSGPINVRRRIVPSGHPPQEPEQENQA